MRNLVTMFMIAAAMIFAASAASADVSTPGLGDINGDGVINILDVQAGIVQALQIAQATIPADVDGNSQVDIADVQNLINTALGTGGLVQRIKGHLAAAAEMLQNGVHLAAVSQDGVQIIVDVNRETGEFTITLPVGKQWSFVFVTNPDADGNQETGTVDFPVGDIISSVLPLVDLSQCDVLDLGDLDFGARIHPRRDLRDILGSINREELLADADANGIPDFLDKFLERVASIPSIGCGAEGEAPPPPAAEGEVRPPLPCLNFATLVDVLKPCIQDNLDAITNISLTDANANQAPDFVEPFMQCLHDGMLTWLAQNGIENPPKPLMDMLMGAVRKLVPDWLGGMQHPRLIDANGNGVPDRLEPFLGKPGLPPALDANGNGIPDFLERPRPPMPEGEPAPVEGEPAA